MATVVDTGPLFALADVGGYYHEPIERDVSKHPDTWIGGCG